MKRYQTLVSGRLEKGRVFRSPCRAIGVAVHDGNPLKIILEQGTFIVLEDLGVLVEPGQPDPYYQILALWDGVTVALSLSVGFLLELKNLNETYFMRLDDLCS